LRVDCSEHSLEQIEKQMHKLVNVLRVSELRRDDAVERELALVTVASPAGSRAALLAAAAASGASVVDFAADAVTFQLAAQPDEVDAFEELLRPHGIRELARTGRIGLHRPHDHNRNGNGNGKEPNG
jgi:acetolactate synthase-1/3 small subunit